MSSHPKKQHYVPQFYLKKFRVNQNEPAESGTQIWCYDKKQRKSYRSGIREIVQQVGFYDYTNPATGETVSIEKNLSQLESKFKVVLDRVLSARQLPTDYRARRDLARFIAYQSFRTLGTRELLRQIGTIEAQLFGEDPSCFPPLQANELALSHIRVIGEFSESLIPMLLEKKWVLLYNRSTSSLWLSDSPVTLRNRHIFPGRGNLGFGVPGVEVYIPLSPRLTLLLCDKEERMSETGGFMDTAQIDFLNRLQGFYARRFVLSCDPDFGALGEMLEAFPAAHDPQRPMFNMNNPGGRMSRSTDGAS